MRELTLYDKCVALGVEIDHYESDLYIKAGPVANKLVAEYEQKWPASVSSFKSNLDGKIWFDIPFAYSPFWRAVKQESKARKQAAGAVVQEGGAQC